MLTSAPLGQSGWTAIARRAPWQMTRMNLNTFARHGVFQDRQVTRLVAERLRDPAGVRKARVFPYQLMMAYSQTDAAVPDEVREALQDAMEVALENVPEIDGRVHVSRARGAKPGDLIDVKVTRSDEHDLHGSRVGD
jgi:60 kDa SS-A/Ro ribonucleoprotein